MPKTCWVSEGKNPLPPNLFQEAKIFALFEPWDWAKGRKKMPQKFNHYPALPLPWNSLALGPLQNILNHTCIHAHCDDLFQSFLNNLILLKTLKGKREISRPKNLKETVGKFLEEKKTSRGQRGSYPHHLGNRACHGQLRVPFQVLLIFFSSTLLQKEYELLLNKSWIWKGIIGV